MRSMLQASAHLRLAPPPTDTDRADCLILKDGGTKKDVIGLSF